MELSFSDIDDFENENESGIINDGTVALEDNKDDSNIENVENSEEVSSQEEISSEDNFVGSLLKSIGIKDPTKIKFENEDGTVEEKGWDSLSVSEQLNIFNSSLDSNKNDLDTTEVQLINTIRNSGMSPSEYIEYLQQEGVNRYIQNSQQDNYQYSVDQYSDDDLYIFDLISRTGVTEEEAQELLERAKSNETLFAKQIGAIRNEYKEAEKEQLAVVEQRQKQQAQEQYNQFAQSIVAQINEFKDFSGYNIDMDNEEMQELYEFITGFDAAGNNHFYKALADPKVVVQMAYFALNGQRLIDDITNYFQKEITSVGKESYARGLADAQKKNNRSNIVFKDKQKPTKQVVEDYNDLDDF